MSVKGYIVLPDGTWSELDASCRIILKEDVSIEQHYSATESHNYFDSSEASEIPYIKVVDALKFLSDSVDLRNIKINPTKRKK